MNLDPLPSLQLNQNGTIFYLTSVTAKQLEELEREGYLKVERYQYQEEEEAYQRNQDPTRVKDLSEFLAENKDDKMVARILPGSTIFNFPDKRDLTFDASSRTLTIKENPKINIVDGQHRISGLLEAYRESKKKLNFELPVTMLTGFNTFQEAAQFLLINLKQKGVSTDLTLTVLHKVEQKKTKDLVKRLRGILKVDAWKLDGTAIAMDLNDSSDNPWGNHILRPNEERNKLKKVGRKWIPIRQAGFVDTLRYFCMATKTDEASRVDFLKRFWNGLSDAYPKAFNDDTGKNYILTYGNGVGVFHLLATAFYNLDSAGLFSLEDCINKFTSRYSLEDWENDSEMVHTWGSSQKEFRVHAETILAKLFSELDMIDEGTFKEYNDNNLIEESDRELMEDLFDVFTLKPKDLIEEDLKNDGGIYLLVDKKNSGVTCYIGQSKVIRNRLAGHSREFKAFSKIVVEKNQLNRIEALAYHLTKKSHRTNDAHPPYSSCEFCKK
jgi:DGQHR domain-containing protein